MGTALYGFSMISLRKALLSSRSNVWGAVALAVTCLALIWAHSGLAAEHMGHEASDSQSPMTSLCVAILEAAGGLGLALAAWRSLRKPQTRRRDAAFPTPCSVTFHPVAAPLARAGPSLFGVFRR